MHDRLGIVSRASRIAIVGTLSASLALAGSPLAAWGDTQSDLAAAQAELTRIGEEYQQLSAELTQAGADLETTNGKIAETQTELEGAQSSLADDVSVEYKGGGLQLLDVLLGSRSFNDLISQLFYAGKMNQAQAEAIAKVKELQSQLESQKSDQEAKLAETQAKVDQQSANQQAALDLVNSLSAEVKSELEAEASQDESIAAGLQSASDGEASQSTGASTTPVAGTNGNASQQVTDGGSSSGGSSAGSTTGSGSSSGSNGSASKPSGGTSGGSSSSGSGSGGSTGTSSVSSPISYALAMAGAPYVSGGESMAEGGFDCSGLVYYAYRQIGITLPRTSDSQMAYFKSHGRWTTSVSQLQYGDVVFFPGHVAFYVGNGQIFGARRPGVGASTTSMSYFGTFLGGGQL